MIRVVPPPEPPDFDSKVRQPGNTWLAAHPKESRKKGKRPRDLWSPFRSQLADGFQNRCGYAAMWEPSGTVDHYLSCEHHEELAYEWSNYRYVSGWINSKKGSLDERVLDPFDVDASWFELLLPSCQLIVSEFCPSHLREKAEFTLQRLGLGHNETIIRQRAEWYRMYKEKELTLKGLASKAPLLAIAVEKASPNLP